jgi:hypothetical protein
VTKELLKSLYSTNLIVLLEMGGYNGSTTQSTKLGQPLFNQSSSKVKNQPITTDESHPTSIAIYIPKLHPYRLSRSDGLSKNGARLNFLNWELSLLDFSFKQHGKMALSAAESNDQEQTPASPSSSNKRLRATTESEPPKLVSVVQPEDDVATLLGYEPGHRFEVEWDVGQAEKTHWWGATLLAYDGRAYTMTDEEGDAPTDSATFPIRVLDYDPYLAGGFPERSQEDVVFLSHELLLNPTSGETLSYRPHQSTANNSTTEEPTLSVERHRVEDIVNVVLEKALAKVTGDQTSATGEKWKQMSPGRQALIARKVAARKEKLVELLSNFPAAGSDAVITAQDMQSILVRTMEEGNDE